MDLKEAAKAAAPRRRASTMPAEAAERVVEGARHLSPLSWQPNAGGKAARQTGFVRELMPQDLKIEIERLTADEATDLAGFLARNCGQGSQSANGRRDQGAMASRVSGATEPNPWMRLDGCGRT